MVTIGAPRSDVGCSMLERPGLRGAVVALASLGTAVLGCSSSPSGMPGCTNTCRYADDGACDDGRTGSTTALCAAGTDCNDCGPLPGASADAGGSIDAATSDAAVRLCSGEHIDTTEPYDYIWPQTPVCPCSSLLPGASTICDLEPPPFMSTGRPWTARCVVESDGSLGCWWGALLNRNCGGTRNDCESWCPTCCLHISDYSGLSTTMCADGTRSSGTGEAWLCPPTIDLCP